MMLLLYANTATPDAATPDGTTQMILPKWYYPDGSTQMVLSR